jgi:1,4-dihydroxy-2-naphthoyl-CoA hydrolase
MSIWKKKRTPTDLNAFLSNSMAGNLGIDFLELGDDYLKASMPLSEKTRQNMGFMHGGANVVLAETLGNIASILCCEEGKTVVGLEINANHIRPGFDEVTGIAKPIHLGRSTMIWEIKIYNTDNKLTCISRFTGAVIVKTD